MSYKEFYRWVYVNLKIDLEGYKQAQLTRRIENLMKRLEIKDLSEFVRLMEKNSLYKEKLLDFITINVTEFFRNPELYNNLAKSVDKYFPSKTARIKVWSAACSLGCEPYSLAMLLKEKGYKNFIILATDIDEKILQLAKKGKYSKNELKNLPKEYFKYFKDDQGTYYLGDEIKSYVNFKKADLILDSYESSFDLILCRNVVIYFNNDVKTEIYKKIYKSLNIGGLFFVGATESITNFKELGFEKESTFIYRKV
ncbi:MAG: CheR family methyltransferase [Sarcina sp.]